MEPMRLGRRVYAISSHRLAPRELDRCTMFPINMNAVPMICRTAIMTGSTGSVDGVAPYNDLLPINHATGQQSNDRSALYRPQG